MPTSVLLPFATLQRTRLCSWWKYRRGKSDLRHYIWFARETGRIFPRSSQSLLQGSLRECERYSISSDKWEVFTSLPTRTARHAGAIVKNGNDEACIFVCGGCEDDQVVPTDETLILRPDSPRPEWELKAKMPTRRFAGSNYSRSNRSVLLNTVRLLLE